MQTPTRTHTHKHAHTHPVPLCVTVYAQTHTCFFSFPGTLHHSHTQNCLHCNTALYTITRHTSGASESSVYELFPETPRADYTKHIVRPQRTTAAPRPGPTVCAMCAVQGYTTLPFLSIRSLLRKFLVRPRSLHPGPSALGLNGAQFFPHPPGNLNGKLEPHLRNLTNLRGRPIECFHEFQI